MRLTCPHRLVRKSLLLLMLVSLGIPPLASQDSQQALLVFYRPKRVTGSGLTPSIYVDGQQVARLDNGRFFSLRIDPGTHKIKSSMKHAPLELEVDPGETIYLEMVILMGMWRGGGRIIPAPEKDATVAIVKLKPLDHKWIFDDRVGFDLKTESNGSAESETQPEPESELCIVRVNSKPEWAEVELDGKFVGSTPATLRLEPGDYTITVKKAGYKDWERTVTALAGNELRIAAELSKEE